MLLNDDQVMIRDAVRAFAQEQLWPHAAQWDKDHHFPKAAHQGLAELGAYGICVPEQYGGAGLDYLTLAVVLEEIAAGDGGVSTTISVTNCPVNAILMRYGNEAQKQRWLVPWPRESAGRLLPDRAARGLRRLGPAHHRHPGRRPLRAQRRQAVHHQRPAGRRDDRDRRDRQGRRQEGHQRLHRAHEHAGLRGGAAGRQAGPAQQRHGADQFRRLPHPGRNRIGEEGEGYKIALSALEGGRIGIAAQSVGMARSALDVAIAYAKQRESFGQPIFNHQAVGFRLAECATQLEAARQLIWHAAALRDAGQPCLKEAAMAKLFASEMAEKVCSAAIQTLGGYGVVSDFPVERIYRDVRVCQIYEGTSDVQKILIQRAL
jgi:butyryl-CoA dehydrogenase